MNTRLFKGWKWFAAVTVVAASFAAIDQTTPSRAQDSEAPAASKAGLDPKENFEVKVPATVPSSVSPRVAELAKLIQSSVNDDVVRAFIKNSPQEFSLNADEILYLSDLGLSDDLLTEVMHHKSLPTAPPASALPPVSSANANVAGNVLPNSGAVPPPPGAGEVITPVATPPQVTSVSYFYDSLRPYGSWVEVDDYGLCWQPTVVVLNRDWRPYCDRGRWIYSDCGWYWHSDYSWGWAPFHYGRWHYGDRCGWVWAPDCNWGPSWVSWRHSDSYYGWAPLPPAARFELGVGFAFGSSHVGIGFDFGLSPDRYCFVPAGRFCDRAPSRYLVTGTQSGNIYRNSTVINNYIVGNNNTVINEGIGRDRVARATRANLQPVALRAVTAPSAAPPREVLDRQRNALTVYKPAPITRAAANPGRIETANLQTSPNSPARVNASARPSERPGPINRDSLSAGQPTSPNPAAPDRLGRAERPLPRENREAHPSRNETRNPRLSESAPPVTAPRRVTEPPVPPSRFPGSDVGRQVIGRNEGTEVAQLDRQPRGSIDRSNSQEARAPRTFNRDDGRPVAVPPSVPQSRAQPPASVQTQPAPGVDSRYRIESPAVRSVPQAPPMVRERTAPAPMVPPSVYSAPRENGYGRQDPGLGRPAPSMQAPPVVRERPAMPAPTYSAPTYSTPQVHSAPPAAVPQYHAPAPSAPPPRDANNGRPDPGARGGRFNRFDQ